MSEQSDTHQLRPQFPQHALLDPVVNRYVLHWFGRGPTERNCKNQTPLTEAVSQGDETSVFMILLHVSMHSTLNGDDPETNHTDEAGPRTRTNRTIRQIVNAVGDQGWSALHEAVGLIPPNENIVNLLLNHGADRNMRDEKGYSALHFAVDQNVESIVELLLGDGNEVQVDCTDYFIGQTPLHQASMKGNAFIVGVLLNAGATINRQSTYLGRTPLHLAAENGHVEVVQLLIRHGADVSIKDEDLGDTPLHLSCGKDRAYEEEYIFQNGSRLDGGIERVATVKALIEQGGADVNAMNTESQDSPLHCAVRAGATLLVQLLIEAGANVNINNVYAQTPLHVAAEVDDLCNAKILIDNGADLTDCDEKGFTPLQVAHLYCSKNVKTLIEEILS